MQYELKGVLREIARFGLSLMIIAAFLVLLTLIGWR